MTYAELDGFDPEPRPPTPERGLLDRWIVSRLHALIATVRAALDAYDAAAATRAIERFVDDLSTWYVRRSPPPFGGSTGTTMRQAGRLPDPLRGADDADAAAGAVPAVPGRAIYQNLVRSLRPPAPAREHQPPYPPEGHSGLIDADLDRAVELARLLVGPGGQLASRPGSECDSRSPPRESGCVPMRPSCRRSFVRRSPAS